MDRRSGKHHPPRVACSPMNIITDVAMESERYRHAGFRSLKRSVTAAGTRTSAKPRPPCRARCDRPHRNNWELTEPELGAHLEGATMPNLTLRAGRRG